MKHITLTIVILALSLAACAAPTTPSPVPQATAIVESNLPVPSAVITEAVTEPPQGKMVAPSFEAQTYINEAVGFAIEYPASWTANETVLGDRGSQTQLLSTPEIADLQTLPAGATRVTILINQWEPKNDLAAFVDVRKTAWESSGFTILDEEPLTLDLGLAAVRFTVQTADGVTVLFQFAAVGDQYLTISGEGDLALVEEIMRYLRPIGIQ